MQRLHQLKELIEDEVTLEENQEILKTRDLTATRTPKRGWKICEKEAEIEAHLSTLAIWSYSPTA